MLCSAAPRLVGVSATVTTAIKGRRRPLFTRAQAWLQNISSPNPSSPTSTPTSSKPNTPPRPPRPTNTSLSPKNMAKLSAQQLKVPKGTRDWIGSDMILRDRIFQTITEVFKRHGGTALDTPVFELREILAGKYGEDSKLIYDLQDQGGEICSLRYDLTVPLARFLAMNSSIQQLKRYQISKVYRRDQPAMSKGRMREFYQCDFDIAGAFDPMIPDAEIISIIVEVFKDLKWENVTIKINHRKILDGLFAVCGVPAEKIRTISSAVDKLDKLPWADVRKEMTEEKGLDDAVADRIGEYVKHKGGRDIIGLLKSDEQFMANADAKQGVEDMEQLFGYLEALHVADKLSFDLSLARGLDYYTGVIFEVVTEGSVPKQIDEQLKAKLKISKKPLEDGDDRSNDPTVGVGSIAAGGRYDNLVGMFSGKRQIPCVGISFGVDRIFSVMKARMEKEKEALRASEVDVFVMAFGMGKDFTGLLPERMALARELWDANIRAEFLQKVKAKLPPQFTAAENKGIPLAVIIGEDELAQGIAKLKLMGLEKVVSLPDGHPDKTGRVVKRENLVAEIRRELEAKRWINYHELPAEGVEVPAA